MQNTDEIVNALTKLETTNGIEKIDLLNTLSRYYTSKDVTLSIKYSLNAKEIAEELGDNERLEMSLLILGKCYYRLPDYPSAIEVLSDCVILSESLNHIANQIDALTSMGMCQNFSGDYSRALDSHFKALKLCREIGDTKAESESLMQIGLSYIGNKENQSALEFLQKSYDIKIKTNNKLQIAYVTGNIGNLYLNLENFEKAKEYFEKCKILFEELDNKISIGKASMNIGIALGGLHRHSEAMEAAEKSLKIFTELNAFEPICTSLSTIGYIHFQMNEFKKAIEYYDKSIELGEKYFLNHTLEHLYFYKSKSAVELGDYYTAYEFQLKFHTLVEGRLKESAEVKTRYLNVANKVDILKKESEVLTGKNEKLKELNEQLTLLNNEKSEFLAIAAHDLKNPLTSISLSATTIKKYLNTFPKEKIESHLDKIAETSDRMKNIVTNLININAIEAGEYVVANEELNLYSLLKYIVDDFQHRASNKGIEIILSDTEEIKITTDENAIYSILDNLISNAIKYSSEGSFIFVTLGKTDKVIIEIKDNGLGIQESEKEKVFQKFSRISNKPTAGENSTGLGLSIVKKLTELINGKIYFESEYGKGTTFTLELPL